jgi:hypothetical protein
MSESVKYTLTAADAEVFIKKARGATLFIAAGQRAPIEGKEGYEYPMMGHVPVTRKIALRFLANMYSDTMRAKGALCVITTLDRCVFIGQAA